MAVTSRWLWGVIGAIYLAGCGESPTPIPSATPAPVATQPEGETGIEGRFYYTVTGGTVPEMTQAAYNAKIASGVHLVIETPEGAVVSYFTTGTDGSFRVPLDAGAYVLRHDDRFNDPGIFAPDLFIGKRQITVACCEMTHLDIRVVVGLT